MTLGLPYKSRLGFGACGPEKGTDLIELVKPYRIESTIAHRKKPFKAEDVLRVSARNNIDNSPGRSEN
jgi:hypothetical protein